MIDIVRMTPLRRYIDSAEDRLTHEEWARLIGISRSYFTEIINGAKPPSRRVIGRVATVTGGKVSPNSWFESEAA
jgi:plasmid maintenance system antidote protein VapI